LINEFTPVRSRRRSQVDEVVGGAHDGVFVFDDNEGVALVTQRVHDGGEAVDVAGVEANGGFVEDEEGSC
jgi:hypothetical protein